jgi:uncharacterized protein YjbJ (UPF0337 family)
MPGKVQASRLQKDGGPFAGPMKPRLREPRLRDLGWHDAAYQATATKSERRIEMDWNRIEGNWKQVKGKVKEQWGKLTDDDLNVISGKREQLEGKLQERYGYGKDQVRKEVETWYSTQRW